MGNFLDDTIQSIVKNTASLSLLFAGLIAVAFVAGMFYGIAYKNDNTFWWPVYILVIILVLKIVNDLTPPRK